MLFRKIYNAGDVLEDKVRGRLSHYPIIYAFIGGIGIVIFWRGVWHTIDWFMNFVFLNTYYVTIDSLSYYPWWNGPLSILIGTVLLLTVGLFVNNFIGNDIISSGLKKEKKLVEKAKADITNDLQESLRIEKEIKEMHKRLKRIEKHLKG